MNKRKGAKSRRAVFETERIREMRRDFSSTILSIESHHARSEAKRDRFERELIMERANLRAVVEAQRQLLSHPWRHLLHWVMSAPVTRQQKGGD